MAIAKWREKKNGGRITNDNIRNVINYVIQDSKTNNKEYIYCHECDWIYGGEDFKEQTLVREQYNDNKRIEKPYDEFYVSYGQEVYPEEALEYIKEIAKRYLGDDYQYLIAVHNDADHIHGHVVFNCSNLKTHKMFDSSSRHRIDDLRAIVNQVSKEHDLVEVAIRKEKPGDNISRNEYYAKKFNRSYKQTARTVIDSLIEDSNSLEDLLMRLSNLMEVDQSGKYTKIKVPGAERFCRLTSLGSDYYEESIRYRIEHRSRQSVEKTRLKYISTDTEKMKENYGLQRWADKQNVDIAANRMKAINEIRRLMKNGSIKQQLDEKYLEQKKREEALKERNDEIKELTFISEGGLDKYRSMYRNLIMPYKKIVSDREKEKYRKAHQSEFKEYDRIRKILKRYSDEDGKKLPDISEINEILGQKQQEYYELYAENQDALLEIEHMKELNSLYRELSKTDANLFKQ